MQSTKGELEAGLEYIIADQVYHCWSRELVYKSKRLQESSLSLPGLPPVKKIETMFTRYAAQAENVTKLLQNSGGFRHSVKPWYVYQWLFKFVYGLPIPPTPPPTT